MHSSVRSTIFNLASLFQSVPTEELADQALGRGAKQFFLDHYNSRKWPLLFYTSLVALQSMLALPVLYLTKEIFDTAIPNSNATMIIWIGVGIVVLRIASSVAEVLIRMKIVSVVKSATKEMRLTLLHNLFRLSYDFHANSEVGELHSRVVQDTQRVDAMSSNVFGQLIPSILFSVPLLIVMFYLSTTLTVSLLLVAPFIYLSSSFSSRYVKKSIERFHKSFENFSKGTYFVLEHIELTRSKAFQNQELDEQAGMLDDLRRNTNQMALSSSLHNQLQTNMVGIAGILILVIGGISILNNSLSLGEFVSFYAAAALLNTRLTRIVTGIPVLLTGMFSLKTMYALISSDETEPYSGSDPLDFSGHIELSDVGFNFGDKPLLNSVNLKLSPGSTTLVMGKNGAGKSTLVNLILGYYRPSSGRLLSDSQPYDDIDIHSLRRQIGLVPQKATLFTGDIEQNIVYGNRECSPEDMKTAAKQALAHDFISQLPDQYQTKVGKNGARLSGGEIQKIVIARALINEPKLLILDEPTNHLDVESIARLIESLQKLPTCPAILIISHSESIIGLADSVHRLHSGALETLA